MDENSGTELAIFRFSIIAPVINGLAGKPAKDYFQQAATKSYQVPGLGTREFAPRTLRHWCTLYRKHGLEGLKPSRRTDQGKFRALSRDTKDFILHRLSQCPTLSSTALYQEVVNAQLDTGRACSLSTVQRFLKTVPRPREDTDRKRFELRYANDCWQSDVMDGPYLKDKGAKKKAYLIGFIDDASRLVTHAQFSFAANSAALEAVLRTAIAKRGVPKRIFVDNGKIFQARQLRLACARLGIGLRYAKPYSAASKGKIERFWRTLRLQLLESIDSSAMTLDELNAELTAYLENTYHRRHHGSLEGKSPMERWLEDQSRIRLVDQMALSRAFLCEVVRRASKDATISVCQNLFEVPSHLAGSQVRVHYDPQNLSRVFLQEAEGSPFVPVGRLRKIDNSTIPRGRGKDAQAALPFAELFPTRKPEEV